MAESEAAVTDTHPLIFHAASGRALGAKAATFFERCDRGERIIYVPTPVLWEVSLLSRTSRINLRLSVRDFFDELFSNPAYQPLDATPEHVFVADELRFTRDPFDGLICAAARTMGLPLITRDAEIERSGTVKTIW